MKLIFLDFDGVLNGRSWLMRTQHSTLPESERYFNNPCDPELVARLDLIIEATAAKVVISSSWRIGHRLTDLRFFLQKAGLKNLGTVMAKTPTSGPRRGNEIQAFLDSIPVKPESFVILDDDSDMEHLSHHLVQTDCEVGLTDKHVERAIKLLNEGHQ